MYKVALFLYGIYQFQQYKVTHHWMWEIKSKRLERIHMDIFMF